MHQQEGNEKFQSLVNDINFSLRINEIIEAEKYAHELCDYVFETVLGDNGFNFLPYLAFTGNLVEFVDAFYARDRNVIGIKLARCVYKIMMIRFSGIILLVNLYHVGAMVKKFPNYLIKKTAFFSQFLCPDYSYDERTKTKFTEKFSLFSDIISACQKIPDAPVAAKCKYVFFLVKAFAEDLYDVADYANAALRYSQAIFLFQTVVFQYYEDDYLLAGCFDHYGISLENCGDYETAKKILEEALKFYRTLNLLESNFASLKFDLFMIQTKIFLRRIQKPLFVIFFLFLLIFFYVFYEYAKQNEYWVNKMIFVEDKIISAFEEVFGGTEL